jgi:predicted nucleic acid-binding protein
VRLVGDTGVFSAALSRRRRASFEAPVARLAGQQLFVAVQTVAELRYGALVAQWGQSRRTRLETAIAATTVVPVTDSLLDTVATLPFECRRAGHPFGDRSHHQDLWIAAAAIHINAHLITADGIFADVPRLTLG